MVRSICSRHAFALRHVRRLSATGRRLPHFAVARKQAQHTVRCADEANKQIAEQCDNGLVSVANTHRPGKRERERERERDETLNCIVFHVGQPEPDELHATKSIDGQPRKAGRGRSAFSSNVRNQKRGRHLPPCIARATRQLAMRAKRRRCSDLHDQHDRALVVKRCSDSDTES